VGLDRGRHHAEADAEERLLGDLVARLEPPVEKGVLAAQAPTAQLGGSVDPVQIGLGPGPQPALGLGQLSGLGLAVDLFEHGHVVVALAPHELLRRGLGLGVGVEEGPDLGLELVQGGGVGHRVTCGQTANLTDRSR
jgi:hypothetical protein